MTSHLGEHAVVIGGSIAGLMSARVLADYFDSVTVLERDQIDSAPAVHKSIPQGNHVHGIWPSGMGVMTSLYPGFLAKLEQLGSIGSRLGKEAVIYFSDGKAYSLSGTVREPRDLGIDFYQQSRGLLEYCVRQSTVECPNVDFQANCSVDALICRNGGVTGVRCGRNGDATTIKADLVIDTGGRGSHVTRWLAGLGFRVPGETTIGVDMGYCSAKFRVPDNYDRGERFQSFAAAPAAPHAAITELIEGDIWLVSLCGRFGHYASSDEADFLRFVKSLQVPRFWELISAAERVSDFAAFRYPTAVWRHYERMPAFPDGLLVLGDAIASFNPVYGQGMSVAALQVHALQSCSRSAPPIRAASRGLGGAFFPKAAEIADNAWRLASEYDFTFPQTQGERPPNLYEHLAHFAAVDALTADDPDIHRLLVDVVSLCKPVSALYEEPLRSRVAAEQRKHPEKYGL
jgi:2-polyprenyl-6-methoxyphenol hydroxylase-like FAD-dependent oxidoreductase